jgi:hypothetical protein
MGQFYANIALKTNDLDLVEHELATLGRDALVVRQGSITMVYDRRCDDQDIDELARLSRSLSERAECVALASCNHDDDVLLLILCDRGMEVDQYDSTPGYFEGDAGDAGDAGDPSGGDAGQLCAAFGVPKRARDVDQLLRRTHRATVVEGERHHALALALELPPELVMLGYRYAMDGELPEVDDRREVGTPSSPERVGAKQAREAMRLDAEAARLMVESQGPDGSFWHTCALALHRATVPERFQVIFGVAEGNGSLLLDRAREYVRSRGLLGPQGEVVADDLLAELLGQRSFDFPAMAKLVRAALDIPSLTDGEMALYNAGDPQFMARIAQGFISGVIDR